MKYPPYKQGTIDVSDGHTLNYELYGNPKGIPLVYLHGGPGGGFGDDDKRFFDPKVWNVLLFDQRGSGKSTPFASVKDNDTWKLVGDINVLTKKFNLKKFILFGGSWGSTLSLVYAITHPDRVLGMVLRGIHLNMPGEDDHMFYNAKFFRPQVWERFASHVPQKERGNIVGYYLNKILSGDKKTSEKYCFEFSLYELSILFLRPNLKKIEHMLKTDPVALSLAKLESYFTSNNFFLEKDFMKNNVSKIKHIPAYIVHGTCDLVCPPSSAYTLHKYLPKSTLKMVVAGHASSEPAITKALVRGLKEMEKECSH